MAKRHLKNIRKAGKGTAENKSINAKNLDVSRSAVTQCLQRNEKFREIYDDATEKTVDKARSNADKSIHEGDMKTTRWYLERRADEYRPKQEITHKGDILQLRPRNTMKEIRKKNKKGK